MPDTDDEYVFDAADLSSDELDLRRSAVMCISREGISGFESELLDMLEREEDQSLRRHIVRCLGNIDCVQSVPALIAILEREHGLILGDTARALGRLSASEAASRLEELSHSSVDWVSNQARRAIKDLDKNSKK